MKPILLYLVVVEMVTGEKQQKLYQNFFQRMQINTSIFYRREMPQVSGSEIAADNQFPFMILMLAEVQGESLSCCSSVLISHIWVMVSGHCIDFAGVRPENIILAGGKAELNQYLLDRLNSPIHRVLRDYIYGVQERRAKRVYFHPERSLSNFINDFALIRLAKQFTLSRMKPVNLPTEEYKIPSECTILGWGISSESTTDGKLKFTRVKGINTTRSGCCKYKKTGNFLCHSSTVGGGLCHGDSGSPIICNNTIYGIASHVISLVKSSKCGSHSEEFYSEVYPVLKWLELTMKKSGGTSKLLTSKFNLSLALMMLYLAC